MVKKNHESSGIFFHIQNCKMNFSEHKMNFFESLELL